MLTSSSALSASPSSSSLARHHSITVVTVIILIVVLLSTAHFLVLHYHTTESYHAHTTLGLRDSSIGLYKTALRQRSTGGKAMTDEELEISISHLNETLVNLNKQLKSIRDRLKLPTAVTLAAPSSGSINKTPSKTQSTPSLPSSHPVTVAAKTNDPKSGGRNKSKAVIFTMDSIPSYEANSKAGGASGNKLMPPTDQHSLTGRDHSLIQTHLGELIIRGALEATFSKLGISLRTIRSDEEFERTNMADYDIILLDTWTWAMRGW